jgi:hypothetical protein
MSIVFTISEVFGSGQPSVVSAAYKLLDSLDLTSPSMRGPNHFPSLAPCIKAGQTCF